MRVATWNVNGLRARFEFLSHWLRERSPDVVGLQELKLTDEQFPREEFRKLGYHAQIHGQKAWNGVAVLTREPADVLQRGLPGQEEFGARLITVRVADLVFTTVYCPNGKDLDHEDYRRKLDWFDALAEHVKVHHDPEGSGILCGDFNICPSALDSCHGETAGHRIFHTEDERLRFRRLLDAGFVDIYRDRFPDSSEYSWWDYRGGSFHKGRGLRIDFLLATRAALARATSVEIDREFRKKKEGLTASDHAPVSADLG